MPKIKVDGIEVTVPEGINLIEAAKCAGREVPHYCYHSKLSVSGNCRMCLVEIEKQPKLQIACNTKVQEGMSFNTCNPRVKEAQQFVLEFILVNHPIDCPVCDQAGECKLQQYYMKYDARPSRFAENKVHKDKATQLGPNVMLDMERCILCSRCIRFCQEVAEEDELCFTERGNHSELTTFPGEKLDNPYSLNTVDICPVGALTSKDFRFKQRVWFLQGVETICPGCATGCNVRMDHNDGKAFRLVPRENEAVNEAWMCDEGRFTYQPVNQENRLRQAWIRDGVEWKTIRLETALQRLVALLKGASLHSILGIGSATYTNEDNFALVRFLEENFQGSHFSYDALEVKNPSQDDYLISPDKNPNRAGVEALGMQPLVKEDKRSQIFIGLGAIPEERLKKLSFENDRKVILFATHQVPEWQYADMVLPVATFAELDGTFTNRQGRVQRIRPAFPPPGESKPVWEILSHLAKIMGVTKPAYQRVEEVFADLAELRAPFKGMNYEKIGRFGALLSQDKGSLI